MTGEVVALRRALPFTVSSGQLEALKWLALGLMLLEHTFRYVISFLPAVPYLLGRLVFPVFVFAFAYALAAAPWDKVRGALVRLFSWAVVAQLASLLVDTPEPRLNVLFTFALGALAAYVVACGRGWWSISLAAGLAALLGPVCEFGFIGVAFVFAVVTLARADWRSVPGWALVLVLLALLAIPNGSHFALLSIPVIAGLLMARLELPRVRGFFYWAYALQFPVFAAFAWVLS